MIYIVKINNKEYEVEVERGKANLLKTTEIAAAVPASAAPAAPPVIQNTATAPTVHTEANAVTAPMPGTIIDVKVTPGNRVKKGDILLVLEAMKMENEILAPEDGVVAQVFVTKGASVSTGDSLISMQ